jgi:hypothetical protein
MRKTNCRTITRMMALYVAGDLVGEPEREVVTHLAACQSCRQLAEEYSESSSLLTQAFAPPEFDTEFYTGIRHAVLGKINDEGITSTRPIFGLWGRNWLYAGAVVAVVIATLALLLVRGISREPSRELAVTPHARPATPEQRKEENSAASRESSGPPLKPDRVVQQTRRPHQLFALTVSRRRNPPIEAARKPDASDTAQTARNIRQESAPAISALESVTLSGQSASSPSVVASSAEISRIEMQTADPNIRIIWLAPRDSREPGPLNHDQDPEMGDRNQEASCLY